MAFRFWEHLQRSLPSRVSPVTGFRQKRAPYHLQRRYRPGITPGYLVQQLRFIAEAATELLSNCHGYHSTVYSECQGNPDYFAVPFGNVIANQSADWCGNPLSCEPLARTAPKSRRGCGFPRSLRDTTTSVSPCGLPPSPQGEGFNQQHNLPLQQNRFTNQHSNRLAQGLPRISNPR